MTDARPAETKERSRSRARLVAAHALAFGAAFVLFKGVSQLKVGAPLSELPWLSSADLGVALALAALVPVSRLLALALMDLCLVYYVINIHFAAVFGGFIESSVMSFSAELDQMTDSYIAELDWGVLAALPLVLLGYRWLARRASISLDRIPARRIVAGLVATGVLCSGIWVADPEPYRPLRHHPLTQFVASMSSLAIEEAPAASSSAFDAASPFASPRQPLPSFVRDTTRTFNVVLILLESTGSVSARREGAQTMPHFDELMQTGVYFSNHYASIPLSIKSIFSVHSGHYPAADFRWITKVQPRIPLKLLPAFFKERGYRTALLHGGYFRFSNKLAFLRDRGYDVLHDGESIPGADQFVESKWGIDDKVVFDHAQRWIDQSDDPFLLTIIPILPHHPYRTPAHFKRPFPNRTFIDRYHNSLRYEDELLGKLVTHLRARGRYEDTLFYLVGDHGEAFNQHRGNRLHSLQIYEENVRVPLGISNPVLFPKPQVSARIGSLVDTLPTLAHLLGFELGPEPIDGASLFGPERKMVFFHSGVRGKTYGLRDGNYKFVFRAQQQSVELYDLSSDPEERHDISADKPFRVAFYRDKVIEWRAYTRQFVRSMKPRPAATETPR